MPLQAELRPYLRHSLFRDRTSCYFQKASGTASKDLLPFGFAPALLTFTALKAQTTKSSIPLNFFKRTEP